MISASSIRSAVNFAAEAADLALAAPAAGRRSAAGVKSARLQLPSLHGGSRTLLAAARRGARSAPRSRTGRSSVAGYAPAPKAPAKGAAKTSSAKSSGSGPLAFLSDPRLSIEDKLMKLLGYMNEKWEKEMQEKLDQIAAAEGGETKGSTGKSSSSGSGSSSGSKSEKSSGLLGGLLGDSGGGLLGGLLGDSGGGLLGGLLGGSGGGLLGGLLGGSGGGGLLGGLGDLMKNVLPGAGLAMEALNLPIVRDVLSKVGGPVLAAGATALGFPEVAPLLLKFGPEIVKAVSSFAGSLDGEGGGSRSSGASGSSGSSRSGSSGSSRSSSSGSSGTSSAAGGSKAMSDSERQTIVMEIQRIQQKQQEMFSLVSNILKTNHDTRAAVIGNIR